MKFRDALRPIAYGFLRTFAPRILIDVQNYRRIRKWEMLKPKGYWNRMPRPMTQFLRDIHGDNPLVGVEIGVWHGENAENILKSLNLRHLYLVDPYTIAYHYPSDVVAESVKQEAMNRVYACVDKTRVDFIIKKSCDAVDDIPNELDFVYIDGDHSYNVVLGDINDYYPKVKLGGVLGGHDFNIRCSGVMGAVVRFADTHDFTIYHRHCDWWLMKP